MSTPRRRRRHSAAVYRRRRALLLTVVLLIVAGVALAIWQPWNGAADAAKPPASPRATTTTPAPTPTATESPAPAETPEATGTEATVAACSTSSITVLAVTDKDSYGAGELPQLSITLSNHSDAPCLINVGTATQAFVITSGSDTWWRSTDCQSESSDQVVQLAAGQTVSSVTPLVWDRTRSSVDTCDSSRPQATAGYYHLAVSIGGIQAADTTMFELR
ncbi:hypothetical protein [Microbacterium sp.]|uniref:hypothetical protein n=1 Tax=Microbacterium sp. TaxID=51671 RepID=UPI0039E5F179